MDARSLESLTVGPGDALVVVDPQNDFLPGGSLAVAEGNRIFGPINRIMPLFSYVVATRDWHPPEHKYFTEHGGPWPYHCLQDTRGAEFSRKLDAHHLHDVVSKGVDPETDGYSGFAGTDLVHRLRARGIRRVFVCGLATDYCVKATALEAKAHGFDTIVLRDAIAAVNVKPEHEREALDDMARAGIEFALSDELRAAA
ncbi:MAG: isochorismatase family protein [Candidatus Eremiobacteraeota bacterium]|nr:isochorismatase family protein [Candidatus Eremiobacteraeota bacterium]